MKKSVISLCVFVGFITSCITIKESPPIATTSATAYGIQSQYEDITQSLFSDKDATISEEKSLFYLH